MLFTQIGAILSGGLALVAASPLAHIVQDIPRRHDAPVSKRTVPDGHVLHERQMPHWASTWKRTAKAPRTGLLPMRIGLKQMNLEDGALKLRDISNPQSVNFGKHLSSEQVIDMFAPSQESVDAVMNWLISSGISSDRLSLSANKQWIQFDAEVHEVEEIMIADFYIFEHAITGTKNVAVDEYHLPKDVQKHVDYITPGIKMRQDPRELKRRQNAHDVPEHSVKRSPQPPHTPILDDDADRFAIFLDFNKSMLTPENCYKYVTAACIRSQYGIPVNTLASPGNELGIFASLNDHYSKADMDAFHSTLYPFVPNGTYPIERLIDGATGSSEANGFPIIKAGVESALDIQSSWPLIWPQNTVLFQTDDQYYEINQTYYNTPYIGFWNTFFDALDGSYCTYSAYGETGDCTKAECLDPSYPNPHDPTGYQGQLQCGVYKPTNVISISYGGGELDLPEYYNKRQCDEIMKLGLQGVTVVMATGDWGVGSYKGDGGYASGCAGENGTIFYPTCDVNCPYALAVGGTSFVPTSPNSTTFIEHAASRFPGGGGFSNYFDAPPWQTSHIKRYFEKVSLNFTGYERPGNNFSEAGNGVYRSGGRGYPDVSAIGESYVLYAQGRWRNAGGTSLSAPIWGAILTLVNEHRLAAGKSSIGLVHEILYSHPEVFNDITNGSNPNCKSSGFLAAEGWDPVTGLGSPNYAKLLELLTSV